MWNFRRIPEKHVSERERARHPSWRRYTRRYAAKRRIVRDVWIVSGLIMLALPLAAQILLALATTFLAFVILDETP